MDSPSMNDSNNKQISDLFNLQGKVAVVLGGGGVLGGAIAKALGQAGACIAIADCVDTQAHATANDICRSGGSAHGFYIDVLDNSSIQHCADTIFSQYGKVDVLVNAVGGNMKEATTTDRQSFFDIPVDAINKVINLNLIGGIISPCQVFGRQMKDNPDGASIINIASISALCPLSRVPAYCASKAAVVNFTQWLAVHFAQEYSPGLRVNAIAPGFFLTAQNRYLLIDDTTDELTHRGRTIIDHTPAGRFGDPYELGGAAVWLASDASCFVTGTVIVVDGGFTAFSGV